MAYSNIIKKRIVCPKCDETTEATLYTSINVTNHKELREQTMNDHFQLADKGLEEQFKTLKKINKRIVPDFNTLKEKIFIFESGLDDMAVELTKLAIGEAVMRKLNRRDIKEAYLSMYNSENNTMGFTYFLGEEREPYVQSARLEIYGKSVSVVNQLAVKDKKLKGFIRIDREWAENILYRYKRGKQVAKLNKAIE